MSWVSDATSWFDTSSESGVIDRAADFGETWLEKDTEKYKAKYQAKSEIAKANAWASVANVISKNILIIGCVIVVAIILKD